jgi:hypothetical protein
MGTITLGTATTDGNNNAIGYWDYSAFRFETTEAGTVDSLDLYVSSDGGLGTAVARIYSSTGSAPNSQIGGDSAAQTSYSAGSTSTFTWSSNKPTLAASTEYYVVFYTTDNKWVRAGETYDLGSPTTTFWMYSTNGSSWNEYYVLTANIIINYTASGPDFSTVSINIGDVWKDCSDMKINIGDDWKDVAAVKINVGDTWKDVV